MNEQRTKEPAEPARIGGSNQLMDLRQVAEYIGRPYRTVQESWRAWGLPGKKVGRAVVFRRRDVDAWVEHLPDA